MCLEAGTLDPKPRKSVSARLNSSRSAFMLTGMKAESVVAVTQVQQ